MRFTENKILNYFKLLLICFLSSTELSISIPVVLIGITTIVLECDIIFSIINIVFAIWIVMLLPTSYRDLYNSYMKITKSHDNLNVESIRITLTQAKTQSYLCIVLILLIPIEYIFFHHHYLIVAFIYFVLLLCYYTYSAYVANRDDIIGLLGCDNVEVRVTGDIVAKEYEVDATNDK